MEMKNEESSSIGVAVRIRPLSSKEIREGASVCVKVDENLKMIIIGNDRPFTFDQVFDMETKQIDLFESCAKNLIQSVFKGYNATILAYGQTGSGKTFTMGSGQLTNIPLEDYGIIPRVINCIFDEISNRKSEAEFIVKVTFIEIYNEDIKDLLDKSGNASSKKVNIREKSGSIIIDGLQEEKVENSENTFKCLEDGTFNRSVSATDMNAVSSRSHAIFTINIECQGLQENSEAPTTEKWVSKFNFVDLAGSERAKKTNASGATLKEGININKGLSCLGNVINALTDETKKNSHIPYRDSKLTRILQDSLGGNAQTFMIACASPAQTNFDETLTTLRYANRARQIKNKPVVNTDPHNAIITSLREEIAILKTEILNYSTVLASCDNEELKKNFAAMQQQTRVTISESSELSNHKYQQLEKRISSMSIELEATRNSLQSMEVECFKIKRERDLGKMRIEKYVEVLRSNQLEVFQEDNEAVKLVDEYLETIQKISKEKEAKNLVIKDLEYEYFNLIKELERDRKILASKSEECERLKFKSTPKLEKPNEVFTKEIYDYGRIFAETVFAVFEENKEGGESVAHINELNTTDFTHATNEDHQDPNLELPTELQIDSIEVKDEYSDDDLKLTKQKEEITITESSIKGKEDKLKSIENSYKEMQARLVDEMSKQYYKKIEEIQTEMRTIERDREIALEKSREKPQVEQNNIADKFKGKIQSLEHQLQENLKKDKELQSLQKAFEVQKMNLAKVNEEIKREKKQKVEMQKKFKEEKDQLLKLKAQRTKEILLIKKSNVKKDQEIKLLKSDNRKKEIVAKRKAEELAAMQKRQRDIALKRNSSAIILSPEVLQQWVKEYSKACVYEKELSQQLSFEIKEKEEFEAELNSLYSAYTDLKIKLERNELILSDNDPNTNLDELYEAIQTARQDSQDYQDQIEILEEKINFKQSRIIEYSNLISNSRVEEIKSKGTAISCPENAQALISVLFEQLMNRLIKSGDLKKKILKKNSEIDELENFLTQLSNQQELLKRHYTSEISRLEKIIDEKTIYINTILEEADKFEQEIVDSTEKDEEIRKLKDRVENYAMKLNKLLRAYNEIKDGEYDKSKPRASYSSNSLVKARELNKQRKLIKNDTQEETEQKLFNPRMSMHVNSKSSLNVNGILEDEPVFERLQKSQLLKSRSSIGQDYFSKPTQKWTQSLSIEAHEGAISSAFLTSDTLITASSQKFKLWSLESFKLSGEQPAHTSFIKSISYDAENNLIFTSCGNLMNYYDFSTLKKINTIKTQTSEIRTIKAYENYLICAGKGNPNSILVWDLRKLDTFLYEKEKNLDVFSLKIYDNIIYYGCRDHKVHRMRLNDFEVVKAFETSHYDTVTSLTAYQDFLISGSRDKNLRIWSRDSDYEAQTIISAHTDWVTCLATDCFGRAVYSGGKEGRIRVWSNEDEIFCHAGDISGHTGAINYLASLVSSQQIILSASSDKTFRVWKLIEGADDN